MRINKWQAASLLCVLFAGVMEASTTFNLSTGTATYDITSDTNGGADGTGDAVDITNFPTTGQFAHINPTLSDGTDTGVWVGPTTTQGTAPGTESGTTVYTVTVDLTNFNAATASLVMNLGADDFISSVVLNSTTIFTPSNTQISGGMYATATASGNKTVAAGVSSGFIAGLNTITFTVANSTGDGAGSCCGPTGLIAAVDVTADASTVPEPGTLATTGLCLLGLAGLLRRRNSARARGTER